MRLRGGLDRPVHAAGGGRKPPAGSLASGGSTYSGWAGKGAQQSGEPALADHRDMPRQRQPCVGQHHVDVTRRQPGGHCDRRVTRDRDLALCRRQQVQRAGDNGSVLLQEDPAAPAVDRRPETALAKMRQRVGQRLADRDPDHRYAGRERDAMRQRQRRPDAGEAARTHGHRHQVECGRAQLCLVQHRARHHRQQRGVTARRRLPAAAASVC